MADIARSLLNQWLFFCKESPPLNTVKEYWIWLYRNSLLVPWYLLLFLVRICLAWLTFLVHEKLFPQFTIAWKNFVFLSPCVSQLIIPVCWALLSSWSISLKLIPCKLISSLAKSSFVGSVTRPGCTSCSLFLHCIISATTSALVLGQVFSAIFIYLSLHENMTKYLLLHWISRPSRHILHSPAFHANNWSISLLLGQIHFAVYTDKHGAVATSRRSYSYADDWGVVFIHWVLHNSLSILLAILLDPIEGLDHVHLAVEKPCNPSCCIHNSKSTCWLSVRFFPPIFAWWY